VWSKIIRDIDEIQLHMLIDISQHTHRICGVHQQHNHPQQILMSIKQHLWRSHGRVNWLNTEKNNIRPSRVTPNEVVVVVVLTGTSN
jgi:hypothetical protein